MSIKFAARGISTQFRTPQELVETDGVTLKPTTGGEVLVSGASGVLVGTAYNATTGGCTVDSTPYADTAALNAAGLYVISDASSAYDCVTETSAGVGVVDAYAIEMLFYLRGSGSVGSQMSKTFSANDYWWTCVQNATDKATLEAFGLTVSRSNSYDTGFGMIDNNDNYTFEIIDLYTDNGITSAGADLSNFFVNHHHHNGETLERVSIDSIDAFSTACLTWKLRITKN